MSLEFEAYHVHTSVSNCLTLPDSTMSVEDYAKEYQKRGMRVLCMSEHGNRGDVWKQAEMAAKYSTAEATMIPIAAAECYFVPDRDPEKKDDRNYHLLIAAKDMTGFRQLNEMLSLANMTGFYRHARVDWELLSGLDGRHFLCTTACVGGVLKDPLGESMCCTLHEMFKDNFYLEIQHHPQQVQVAHNAKVLDLYKKYGWPLIFGTDSHYIRHEDAVLRKELLLSAGLTKTYEDDFDLYLPTPQEAFDALWQQNLFSKAQIEEAMDNTLRFRDFEGVTFTTEKKIPNSRPTMSIEQRNYLYKKEVCDGYIAKAGMPTKSEAEALHQEMDAVTDTGTADYFIAMKDVVDRGITYGGVLTTTGRGSGVSFATNYALGFTSINRLRCPVKLYPERFISKDRLASGALPDLDLNMANVAAFEKAGKEILGEYGCLPMIAFGTTKTLSAFKLLARARNLDFETSNAVSAQIKTYEKDVKHALENNQDDPDYDVDDDVKISQYVEAQYMDLIEDSKQYQGIITNLSPHPCAHLLLDKDIRKEIGVIRVKSKSGNKEPVIAAYIDGQTADAYGYLKADFLRVDVVKTIADSFKYVNRPLMTVDELTEAVKNDADVWDLYANGFTMGLNQCEKEKTTQRVMRYKPKNVVELAAFVAAVRPGFKSMLETFISRTRFSYGIPSLDNVLQTKEIPDSFLMYDEQILSILQAAGISASDAYVCVKAIKKKKAAKVASFRDQFEKGFAKHLIEQEGTTEKEASEIVDKIWTIINDAASYMFCAAHAYSMACDSLYSAYLKAHFPYEFYYVMLKLYAEKGKKDKIALIISEMKNYRQIALITGRFGQDNRDWQIDKTHQTISQSLSSIKNISKMAAEDLWLAGQNQFDNFTSLLRFLQMNTCLNTRQIKILIGLNYFSPFGGNKKLLLVFEKFYESNTKLTKTLCEKTVISRMQTNSEYEASLSDESLGIQTQLTIENENVGLCLSVDQANRTNAYFVQKINSEYGVKANLYNISKGTVGMMKLRKQKYAASPLKEGAMIIIDRWKSMPRCFYQGKTRKVIPGEFDLWLEEYHTV